MEKTVLIMAGGQGERFWPYSRKKKPKQFLCLTDEKRTMIQLTLDRALGYTTADKIFVVTNQDYFPLVREQLPELLPEHILCEPASRNTAPCIALGAAWIRKQFGDALMAVLPADHSIQIPTLFREALEAASAVAREGVHLVTLGITPSAPETGYGYIRFDPARPMAGRAYRVERFIEKPELEVARKLVASGEYLWNSGIFVWKASSYLECVARYLPELTDGLRAIDSSLGSAAYPQVLRDAYSAFPSVSVDRGILEKADQIFTIPGTFGWDDIGSWPSVSRILQADGQDNILRGNILPVHTRNSFIRSSGKLIAAIGVENLIIMDTEDTLLVCSKDRTGDIPQVLQELRRQGLEEYL